MIKSLKITLDNYIITLNTIISGGLASLIAFLSKKLSISVPTWEKLTSYECGFEPFGDARKLSIVGFFIVAMLFLLFDLEVVLLLPWAKQFLHTGMFVYTCIVLYILLLGTGFIYETDKGVLGLSVVVIIGAWLSIGGANNPDVIFKEVMKELEEVNKGEENIFSDHWPKDKFWRVDISGNLVLRTRDWMPPIVYGEQVMEQEVPRRLLQTPGVWYNLGYAIRVVTRYFPVVVEEALDRLLGTALFQLTPWEFATGCFKVAFMWLTSYSVQHWVQYVTTQFQTLEDIWTWDLIIPFRAWDAFVDYIDNVIRVVKYYDKKLEDLLTERAYLQFDENWKIQMKYVEAEAAAKQAVLADTTEMAKTLPQQSKISVRSLLADDDDVIEKKKDDKTTSGWAKFFAMLIISILCAMFGLEACPEEHFNDVWPHKPQRHWNFFKFLDPIINFLTPTTPKVDEYADSIKSFKSSTLSVTNFPVMAFEPDPVKGWDHPFLALWSEEEERANSLTPSIEFKIREREW
jgi:NADH-quinone oxidoreductase subunit A